MRTKKRMKIKEDIICLGNDKVWFSSSISKSTKILIVYSFKTLSLLISLWRENHCNDQKLNLHKFHQIRNFSALKGRMWGRKMKTLRLCQFIQFYCDDKCFVCTFWLRYVITVVALLEIRYFDTHLNEIFI